MMSGSYYVYIKFRQNGTPCYVGKGKGRRCNVRMRTNPQWKHRYVYDRENKNTEKAARLQRSYDGIWDNWLGCW